MPWSLHFVFRGGPEKNEVKKRGRRPGEKSLSPGRRSAQPVIPCQRIFGLNVGAAFRRNSTGCGTRPAVRSPAGASCAATGIFLMAGVIQPLTLGAANKVRRRKNKKAAHTVRPAPTPGPLTLALTFLIHFNDRIKRITRLRTLFNHLSVPALSLVTGQFHLWRATSPAHNGKNPRMTSRREADTTAPPAHNGKHTRMASQREADTTFLKCPYTHFSRLASPYVRENVAFSPASAPPENLLSNTGAAPRPCRLRPVPAEREKNRPVASAGAPV